MIIVASRMTQEERDKVAFKLRDLVSSCILDGEACDMDNDFRQSFDVDYGNCYTFNYAYQPEVKYVTKRTGSASGKRTCPVFQVCRLNIDCLRSELF